MSSENESLKILILMAYYNRPKLVLNALNSILQADKYYTNWELVFGDDGSVIPGIPIARNVLKDHLGKITFIESNHTFEDKIRDGLLLGKYANQCIANSDADIAIVLCDDDELVPTYLRDLNDFFVRNKSVLYCYSKVHIYNPLHQNSSQVDNVAGKFNQWSDPINPVGKVDASQVAWRLDCCKIHGAWFQSSTVEVSGKPWARDTDRSLFQNLYDKCGLCYPTGVIGQFKAIHDYQLLWHKNVQPESLRAYDQMYRELAGVVF